MSITPEAKEKKEKKKRVLVSQSMNKVDLTSELFDIIGLTG